jgi:hypothetical protein
MITASVMALIAAVLLCVGIFTIRTGHVPGPSWLRSMWHRTPSWRTGTAFVALGVSTSLWAVSVLTGNTWTPVVAWLVTGAGLLFEVIMRERQSSQQELRNRRLWYRMPSAVRRHGRRGRRQPGYPCTASATQAPERD